MLNRILPPTDPVIATICDLISSEEREKIFSELQGDRIKRLDLEPTDEDHAIGWNASTSSDNDFLSVLRMVFLNPQGIVKTSKEKPVFLDLGSGTGLPVIYAARDGWQSYGIEFNRGAYEFSIENIKRAEELGMIKQGTARIAHGNFFPEGFYRPRKKSLYDKFRKYLDFHEAHKTGDPYAELNLRVEDVDLFYHYQVELKDPLLRLVEERGKPGAILIITNLNGDIPKAGKNIEDLGSIRTPNIGEKMCIYRKQPEPKIFNPSFRGFFHAT